MLAMRTGRNLERIVMRDVRTRERVATRFVFGHGELESGRFRVNSMVVAEYKAENSFVGRGRRIEDDAGWGGRGGESRI